MFLAATWQHIVITTGGFHQMSVEVLGLAFIYFIAYSPSAKRASLNLMMLKESSGGQLTFVWNYKNRE